jgi:hypothetical protein
MKRKRHIPASLASGLLIGLMLSLFAIRLCAQAKPESGAGQAFGMIGFGPAYDAEHEITLGGSIQEIVTRRESGIPAGVHVLVSGSRGVVDVHLGPLVSAETKAALRVGAPVEIVGAMMLLKGKNYLLARQITVDGRTIRIRSERGLLVLNSSPSHKQRSAKRDEAGEKGGSL